MKHQGGPLRYRLAPPLLSLVALLVLFFSLSVSRAFGEEAGMPAPAGEVAVAAKKVVGGEGSRNLRLVAATSQPGRERLVAAGLRQGRTAGVIVEFAPSTSRTAMLQAAGVDAVCERTGPSPKKGRPPFAVYTSKTLKGDRLAERLRKVPGVLRVSPNNVNTICAAPDDPLFAQLWGLHNTGAAGGTADADVDAPEAWDTTTGSDDVVVAVLDSGVAYSHPDLRANMWVNPGEVKGDGIDNDGNGYVDDIYGIDTYSRDSDPWDELGHGTHVAGSIAAVGNNGRGVTGVAWRTKIMALRFLGPDGVGDDASALEAISYAIDMKVNHGVNVVAINASWGSFGEYDAALADAIAAAGQAGIVFCAAAGNSAVDIDKYPWYPASYPVATLLSVGASDNRDLKADFGGGAGSNYGAANVDLFAPGKDILSTFPGYSAYLPGVGDVFFDDVEKGPNGWTAQSPWTITGERVASGTHAWSDSPYGNYANNADTGLTSPTLDLRGLPAHETVVGFWAAVALETDYDVLWVEASGDNGASWIALGYLTGYYPGAYYNAELPPEVLTAQARVRFRLVSDSTITADGVYLDNIGIAVSPPSDYAYASGTSMATPYVTGAVALLAAVAPGESAEQRVARILAGVDAKAALAGQCLTGGRLNLQGALGGAAPLPVIGALSPSSGPSTGGTSVTITGTGFLAVTGVFFGGVPAASFKVESPIRLTAVSPPHAVGTVQVQVTNAAGSSSDTPADDFTYVTAIPPTTRYEQTDSRLVWSGTWTTSSSSVYSGGSHRYANSSGSSVTVTFSGTYLAWIAKKSPAYGRALVIVDGAASSYVDLYSSTTGYKKKVWDSGLLPSGLHTVRIQWTGQRSVPSGGTNISVDAFDVAGTLKSATRYEQTDSRLLWSGAWTTASSSYYSGGSFRYTKRSGSSVTVNFTGVRLTLIGKKAPNYGIARVSVDGGPPVSVDFYSASTLYKQKVWSTPFLAPGDHSVTITCSGTKRSAARGTNINLDAVDVLGSLR